MRIRRLPTADLTRSEVEAIRSILWRAFPPEDAMTEDDWQHALGGMHFVAEFEGRIVAHASVVERELHIAGRPVRTGYVEAVAVEPDLQRKGLGTGVMREVAEYIRDRFELGALGTGEHEFYERLGWRTWRGHTYFRAVDGQLVATPAEDGYILVLETPTSPPLDYAATISCEWRPGDAW